jgi:hypothetical protein
VQQDKILWGRSFENFQRIDLANDLMKINMATI